MSAEVERLLARAGYRAAPRWARYWWAESRTIAAAFDSPASRWEVLTTGLRRVGWDKEGYER